MPAISASSSTRSGFWIVVFDPGDCFRCSLALIALRRNGTQTSAFGPSQNPKDNFALNQAV